MALIPIMGQPVNLVPDNERSLNCNEQGEYCVVYKKSSDINDRIMVQMKQEPCGEDLIVDGDFPDGDNWTIVTGDIVFADGKANHVTGSSAELSQEVTGVDLGNYYKVSVTVTGMTAGTLDLYFTQAGIYSKRITENGIYTFYLFNLGDNDNIAFVWSSDCDASISGVSAYKLLIDSDIVANLLDADGNIVSAMIIEYHDDAFVFSKATIDLDEGCYTVQIIDPCADAGTAIFTNPNFSSGGAGWTLSTADCLPDFDCSASFVGDELVQVPSATGDNDPFGKTSTYCTVPFDSDLEITEDCYLKFEIEVDAANDSQGFYFVVGDGVGNYTVIATFDDIEVGLHSATIFFAAGSIDPTSLDMGIWISGSYFSGNTNIVKYAQITKIPIGGSNTYQSNCLQVSSITEGTRIVEGFADFTTTTSTSALAGRSLGFLFVADRFWLRSRIPVQFSNPHSPIKTENALYSSGTKKKLYAQVGKIWDVTFSDVDENMHDTIANIINCDTFKIDGFEYITDEKEYSANYGPKGVDTVGESTIEAGRIDGTRFNINV